MDLGLVKSCVYSMSQQPTGFVYDEAASLLRLSGFAFHDERHWLRKKTQEQNRDVQ